MTEMILLKLGELVLKGANRYTFEDLSLIHISWCPATPGRPP